MNPKQKKERMIIIRAEKNEETGVVSSRGVIIPLSSAIRGSQYSYIEDPNYFRTQNVPGLHTLMNARKTYHIYIHNYPNFACTKITPGPHTQLPHFCMYENHARPTYTITPILHVRKTRPAYRKKSEDRPKIEPGLWSRGAPEDGPPPRAGLGAPHNHRLFI